MEDTVYSPQGIAVDAEERSLIESDHARSGRSDLSLQEYADQVYFGCHDGPHTPYKKKDDHDHDKKKKKHTRTHMRTQSRVFAEQPMPGLVPISAELDGPKPKKRMPGLVKLGSAFDDDNNANAETKRMPGLVPISSAMPGLVPIGRPMPGLVPIGRPMPGLVPIGRPMPGLVPIGQLTAGSSINNNSNSSSNPYDLMDSLDASLSIQDSTRLVHSLRTLRPVLKNRYTSDTKLLSSKMRQLAVECVAANDKIEGRSNNHSFTLFNEAKLAGLSKLGQYKNKRAKVVVAASVLRDLLTNTDDMEELTQRVANIRFSSKK